MFEGDIVFFWFASRGMMGWGELVGAPRRVRRGNWEVSVAVDVWLPDAVPMDLIYAGDAIRADNLLRRFPRGTVFRLQPDEVERLAAFLQPGMRRPELDNLMRHELGDRADWIVRLVERLQLNETTRSWTDGSKRPSNWKKEVIGARSSRRRSSSSPRSASGSK